MSMRMRCDESTWAGMAISVCRAAMMPQAAMLDSAVDALVDAGASAQRRHVGVAVDDLGADLRVQPLLARGDRMRVGRHGAVVHAEVEEALRARAVAVQRDDRDARTPAALRLGSGSGAEVIAAVEGL